MGRTLLYSLPPFLLLSALWAPTAWAEEETDELPWYAQEENQLWEDGWSEEAPPPPSLQAYGADIPSPQDVVRGGRPAPAPAPPLAPAPAQGGAESALSFETFRSELAPYGSWVHTPEYGMVFVPHRQREVRDWRPYFYGHWAWTQYGWTWVSDEPFGWATYHYGRWTWSPGLGWGWVPGYVWAPAWVAWRSGPGTIGWAPLYPGYVSVTASFPLHGNHWVFIGTQHFVGMPVHRHWLGGGAVYLGKTRWVRQWRSHGRVYAGPPRGRLQRVVGRPIPEVRVVHVRQPPPRGSVRSGRPGEVRVYRPPVRKVRAGPPPRGQVRSGHDGKSRKGDVRAGPPQRVQPAPRQGGVQKGQPKRVQPAPRQGGVQKGQPKRVQPAPRQGGARSREPQRVQPAPRTTQVRATPSPRSSKPRVKAAPRSTQRRVGQGASQRRNPPRATQQRQPRPRSRSAN